MLSKTFSPGIAFITGGARGLGSAVAASFAKAGARGIALVDIQSQEVFAEAAKEVESHGAECLTISADVTKEEEVKNAISQAVAKFGRIDYAANFAGIGGSRAPIADGDVENFKQVIEVNVVGTFLCTKYQMKQMQLQESIIVEAGRIPQRGSIVNCASVNSIVASAYSAAYTTSKHAVAGLTKVAALEGRKTDIRVNAISPGFIYTKLIEIGLASKGESAAAKWKEFENRQGRVAAVEEIGDAVVLMSSPAMSLLNAHNLMVDNHCIDDAFLDMELCKELPEYTRKLTLLWQKHKKAVYRHWEGLLPTMLHGDSHLGNVLEYPGGTAECFDWQCVLRGNGYRDLAYFVITALSLEDRRAHERLIFETYTDTMKQNGIDVYQERAWKDCCLFALDSLDATIASFTNCLYGHSIKVFKDQLQTFSDAAQENDIISLLLNIVQNDKAQNS
ncbi:hypothetical protein N7520_003038 [Penicillium odoratum]|uniref:uncharacterized protein n=1 Tax=Penicillium odoratum TaxID=1167516 RepID=UPI0025481E1D|nr:uncharacterized protein N7520_003038 [Penicillium odoratum]KAJ5772509.1 hypothetical protein N7520_003038 [Penicillium odoratum]